MFRKHIFLIFSLFLLNSVDLYPGRQFQFSVLTASLVALSAYTIRARRQRQPTIEELHGADISYDELVNRLQEFLRISQQSMQNVSRWCGAREIGPDVFDLDKTQERFYPFASRFVLSAQEARDAKFNFWGDIHGNRETLLASFQHLVNENILDPRSLKIKDRNVRCIFLGDYVDRGDNGVEVLVLLMKLKCVNPESVILLRGNHEDPVMNASYMFHRELERRFPETMQIARKKLINFFSLLPVVCYIQYPGYFIQCSHTGLEVGYDPQPFLSLERQVIYDRIDHLQRAEMVARIPELESAVLHIGDLSDRIATSYDPTMIAQEAKLFGFLWGDFAQSEKTSTILQRIKFKNGATAERGVLWSADTTRTFLNIISSDELRAARIIRGHQHDLALASRGMHLSWERDRPEVITLLANPPERHESNGDAGPADDGSQFHSYARLTDLAAEQQKLTHFVLDADGSLRQEDTRYLHARGFDFAHL